MVLVATSAIVVATDAVAAFPVVDPEDPVTLPVTLAVIGKVDVIAVVDIVSLFTPAVVKPI